MSDREKKLLTFLLVTLFLIGNFFAFDQLYLPKMAEVQRREVAAEGKLLNARNVLAQGDQWKKTLAWLESAEGRPVSYQTANSNLQSFIKRSADRRGLTTKKEVILEKVDSANYSRARVRYKVNGAEQQIQQWVLEIHKPRQLQVITKFDIQPQKNDLTKADCEVEVEKWFVAADEF